jgi:hypothetical protein
MTTTVHCPTCKSKVIWEPSSSFRPFCSKRCQLIDLGQWANEENRLPSGANNNEQTQINVDIEDIEAMLSEQSDDFFKS